MATTKLTDTHLVILSHASRHDDGRVLPLPETVGNKAGRATRALKGLLRRKLVDEIAAVTDDTEWRRGDDGERLTLVITEAGLVAIGVGCEDESPDADGTVPEQTKAPAKTRRKIKTDCRKTDAESMTEPTFRDGTKGAALVDLLRGTDGTTLPDLMEASGWQAHSVRGFLSGTLKKRHGLTIESEKGEDGVRRYRIAA